MGFKYGLLQSRMRVLTTRLYELMRLFVEFLNLSYSVSFLCINYHGCKLPWAFAHTWWVHTDGNWIYPMFSLCHLCSFFHEVPLATLPLQVAKFFLCFCMAILPQIFTVVLSEAYHYVFLLGHYLYKIVIEMWVVFCLV